MKTTKHILFSLIAIIIFFGLFELTCRIKYKPGKINFAGAFEYDKDKIYRLKNNYPGWTNSLGYRNKEISVNKAADTVRILCVGDSITFGHGLSMEESFPARLEARLNKDIKSYKFEVINTGVPGYSAFQEYFDIKRGLIFKPDIVVMQFELNDIVEPYIVSRRYGGRGIDYHQVEDITYTDYFLRQHSALYLFLRDIVARVKLGALSNKGLRARAAEKELAMSWDAANNDSANPRVQEAWRECLKWIQREIDLCKKNNIKCVLLYSPVEFQIFEPSRFYAAKRLEELAIRNNIEYLDMLTKVKEKIVLTIMENNRLKGDIAYEKIINMYRDELQAGWKAYFLDHHHYNREGCILVSDALYPVVIRILKPNNLI